MSVLISKFSIVVHMGWNKLEWLISEIVFSNYFFQVQLFFQPFFCRIEFILFNSPIFYLDFYFEILGFCPNKEPFWKETLSIFCTSKLNFSSFGIWKYHTQNLNFIKNMQKKNCYVCVEKCHNKSLSQSFGIISWRQWSGLSVIKRIIWTEAKISWDLVALKI